MEQRKTDLPFYVTGVNLDATGRFAAVWGRATASESERKFSLGVLDVAQRKLLQKTEFPQVVQSATVDDSGVYVSFDSQLMRLDRQTLEVKSQTNLGFAAELQVIGGKYLAATGRKGSFQRFKIPDLAPGKPAVNTYPYFPLGGRLNDQWLWDGVLWDAELKTPQLLAIPAQFGVPASEGRGLDGGAAGMFAYQTPGRYAGPCNTTRPTHQTSCTPFEYAGFLYVQYGRLNVHPKDRRLDGANAEKPIKSVALSSGANANEEWGYMSCGRDVVAVAYGGQLSWIPTAELLPAKASFAIARKQSTFVLAHGATSVRYEAKDAAKYLLELWTRPPDPDFFQGTHLQADSTDGSFTLSLPPDKLVDDAVTAVSSAQFPGSSGKSLDNYLSVVTPAFESLVGRKPNGVPFPVLAVVTAESSYGETDALVHFYLVEVPRGASKGNSDDIRGQGSDRTDGRSELALAGDRLRCSALPVVVAGVLRPFRRVAVPRRTGRTTRRTKQCVSLGSGCGNAGAASRTGGR